MTSQCTIRSSEAGLSLIEMLFSLVLFSIMGLGLTYSSMTALHTRGRNMVNSAAMQIALETLEDFVAIDPDSLDDTDDQSGMDMTRNGYDFVRSVDVTIEADRSRSVSVTVQNVAFGIQIDLSNSFALWDKR